MTGQAFDEKVSDATAVGTTFKMRALSDDNASATDWLTVTRGSGFTVASVNIPTLTVTTINGAEIDNAAWSTYTPTITSQTGTITTVTATGRYKQIGKTVFCEMDKPALALSVPRCR